MAEPSTPPHPFTDPDCRLRHTASIRLLLLGAGRRLFGAALLVAALWGAFFWATFTPGW